MCYSWSLVASLTLVWRMSCYFIVLVLFVLRCSSSSWCLLIWGFPLSPLLIALLVRFWFPDGTTLVFCSFPVYPIFNPTSRVPSSVHKLAVSHAADWCHALVWTIGIVSCSGIPSSRNSPCPLENLPGNLPSWCSRIEVIYSGLYNLALVGIVSLHVELHPIRGHVQSWHPSMISFL